MQNVQNPASAEEIIQVVKQLPLPAGSTIAILR